MTTEELRELDAEIACLLFSWEWLERWHNEVGCPSWRKAIFPPNSSHWRRWNFEQQLWRAAAKETAKFSDWDMCCDEGSPSEGIGLPHYSTDPAPAMAVLKKCAEKGFPTVYKSRANEDWCVDNQLLLKTKTIICTAETLELAICLFAKKLFPAPHSEAH